MGEVPESGAQFLIRELAPKNYAEMVGRDGIGNTIVASARKVLLPNIGLTR